MNESLSADHGWQAAARSIPGIAWLLVIAAAIQLLVLAASRGVFDARPLPLGAVVGILSGASPLLLAAAVLVGARRWPAGRRWLVAGAALFALRGLLDLGLDLWLASWPIGNAPIDPTSEGLMRLRGLIVDALTVAAPLLLAVGLWIGRPTDAFRGARRLVVVALGLLGILATTAGFFMTAVALTSSVVYRPASAMEALLLILTALHATAFAVLAIAATGTVRFQRWPELAIASGATVWFLASGWLQWQSTEWASQGRSPDWLGLMVSVSTFAALLGMVTLIVGFGAAGLARRPSFD